MTRGPISAFLAIAEIGSNTVRCATVRQNTDIAGSRIIEYDYQPG